MPSSAPTSSARAAGRAPTCSRRTRGTPWSIYGPGEVPISRAFLDDSLGRLVELVDGYQPDLIWFDFDTGYVPPQDLRRFLAFYFNRAHQWGKGVAINDKHEGLFPATGERARFRARQDLRAAAISCGRPTPR